MAAPVELKTEALYKCGHPLDTLPFPTATYTTAAEAGPRGVPIVSISPGREDHVSAIRPVCFN